MQGDGDGDGDGMLIMYCTSNFFGIATYGRRIVYSSLYVSVLVSVSVGVGVGVACCSNTHHENETPLSMSTIKTTLRKWKARRRRGFPHPNDLYLH